MVNQIARRAVYADIRRVFAALICASITALSSCSAVFSTDGAGAKDESPECIIPWGSAEGGLERWGCGGDFLYGASVEPTVLNVWKWNGDRIRKSYNVRITDKNWLSIAWTADDKYLVYAWEDDARLATVFVRAESNRQTQQFPKEKGWCIDISRPSLNGKYVAVWAFPDFSAPGHDFNAPNTLRLGCIGAETREIQWVSTLPGSVGAEVVSRAIPSDDGTLIAVAGWQHGAAVVNVPEKKCLWQKRPQNEVCFTDIVISPDNKLVYAVGTEGCIYGMKVQDGEIVSRWWATPTGKSEYGFRISTVSVSPDGRYVAAGTGPTGLVFLFSTKTGKLLRTLDHGGSTILITSFSPDSKRLASVAVGKIKIWKLPEDAEQPQADKPDVDNTTTVKEPVTQ